MIYSFTKSCKVFQPKLSIPDSLQIGLLWLTLITTGIAQPFPAYEADIRAFEKQDFLNPPPRNGIVFTGSSSIRLWNDIQSDFPGKPVIQRGFGGSELADVIRYADRVIIRYRPKQVIVYAGENDIATAKLSAQQVFERFQTLFEHVRKSLPRTDFVYISIKPSPSRRTYQPIVREANALIRDYLHTQKRATFVDVYTPMLDAQGRMRGELFTADSLHMNRKGYALWAEILRRVVK